VADAPSQGAEQVRAAEVIGALCLATDLGMGFPFEHGLHTTLIATRLANRLEVEPATASQTYYASLLSHSGCTTDAHVTAEVFGGALTTNFNPVMYAPRREVFVGLLRTLPDPNGPALARAAQAARRLPRMARAAGPQFAAMCEVGQMLANGVGLPPSVGGLLAYLMARWDGKDPVGAAKGEEIPLPMRIVHVAADAAFQQMLGGEEHAARVVRKHAGRGLDPGVVTCLADNAPTVLALDREASAWEETLAGEPRPHLTLEGEAIERALAAMGNFADLISPYLTGHSAGVAELAGAAALRCRINDPEALRRAALVHDLGRVAIGARTWQKPGPLSADEWEQVRLHPYHTERVLSRSAFLAALAPVAGAHHERLDGSGYPRGLRGRQVPFGAQVLAVVDTWTALTRPRPHRPAMSEREALAVLRQQAGLGRLPGKLVDALEPLVISGRPGGSSVPGRVEEGGDRLQSGAEPEDPDDPSSSMQRRLIAPVGLALSL
jgi:HD-GYP domain-containing protein (c-di-GMP phosphodiesterase class II)